MTAPQRYEVLGRVATTRSGAVWKARDISLDRLVALKQISSADRDRLYREAAAIAAISSEHIVTVYGVEELEDSAVLVEEWVDGATVAAVLRTNGRMPVGHALGVVRGALLGLAAAHANGLVHGDVSMTNILVDDRGTARLIDFGSVARAGDVAQPTTGAFAAPEVVAGWPATPAADVFASAAVLAALLHGRTETSPSTAGIDGPVRDVLNQALSPQPEQRFPDAGAFLAALERAATQAYGVGWWTQAGLGAAAAASVAAVVPVIGLAVGGATAGSGALAAAGSATASTGGAAGTGLAGAASAPTATAVSSTSSMHSIGQVAGRTAWHSRRVFYGIGSVAAAAAVGVGIAVAASGGNSAAPKANIIVDAGGEDAAANAAGTAVPTNGWTVANPETNKFTAVRYGVNGLPETTSSGAPNRGKNLFSGGETGDTSTGTQVDSLSRWTSLIKAGNAKFTLSAWLGGYASQGDSATLTVTWRTSSGESVGTPTTIGPVTAADRKSVTELLQRTASGIVPQQATSALITLRMVRTEGTYNDGYADNLSLTIAHK